MHRILKRVIAFSAIGIGYNAITAPKLKFYSFSDSVVQSPTSSISTAEPTGKKEEEDEEWPIEKEECPFCRHFLQSPCANQFKKWSKCVDKCKVDETDFVKVCEEYTKDLLDCTALHVDYFKVIPEANNENSDDSHIDDNESSQ